MRTISITVLVVLLASALYYWPVVMALGIWVSGALIVQREYDTQLKQTNQFDFERIESIRFGTGVFLFLLLPITAVLSTLFIWRMVGGLWLE